jgi:hypothetical protein
MIGALVVGLLLGFVLGVMFARPHPLVQEELAKREPLVVPIPVSEGIECLLKDEENRFVLSRRTLRVVEPPAKLHRGHGPGKLDVYELVGSDSLIPRRYHYKKVPNVR